MNSISRYNLTKYQVSPIDTLNRLRNLNAQGHIKMWAGAVIWWNGGYLDDFDYFADNCPPLSSSLEPDGAPLKFSEKDLETALESVGFSLKAGAWAKPRGIKQHS